MSEDSFGWLLSNGNYPVESEKDGESFGASLGESIGTAIGAAIGAEKSVCLLWERKDDSEKEQQLPYNHTISVSQDEEQ